MNTCSPRRRPSTIHRQVTFQLIASRTAVQVDLRIRTTGDRWVADSNSSGRQVTAIGSTARAATVASLEWLGAATVAELLADLRLLEVSRQLLEVSAR